MIACGPFQPDQFCATEGGSIKNEGKSMLSPGSAVCHKIIQSSRLENTLTIEFSLSRQTLLYFPVCQRFLPSSSKQPVQNVHSLLFFIKLHANRYNLLST